MASKKKSPPKPASGNKHKVMNAIYAFLLIFGMLVSALGLKTRTRSSAIALAQETASPVALTWRLQDQPTGQCQELLVYADGILKASACSPATQEPAIAALSQSQKSALQGWLKRYAAFSLVQSAPKTGPSAQVRLAFSGAGAQTAASADQQAIEQFVEQLAAELW